MATVFSSDKFTQTAKQLEYYSDFTADFDIHPGLKDLSRLTNEEAVKRAVRNLLLTNSGERPFQPAIGANLSQSLFEMADNESLDSAQDQVLSTLRVFEPRIKVLQVSATLLPDNNSMTLTVIFSLINNEKPVQLSLILFRVR
jgi:phage baseplate assembly protein W